PECDQSRLRNPPPRGRSSDGPENSRRALFSFPDEGADVDVIRWLQENHWATGVLMTLLGLVAGWALGRWRRPPPLRPAPSGRAREVLAAEQMLIRERPDGRTTMRIRSCGSAPLASLLPNPAAHDAFLARASATKPAAPLISMADPMGSFLLYLLTPWVC